MTVVAALFFAGGLALLGISKWFWMAVAAVLILGFMDSISVTVRRTVVQILAPDKTKKVPGSKGSGAAGRFLLQGMQRV